MAAQILYDLGTSEPGQIPNERLGLVLCLLYLSQVVLPFGAWAALAMVAALILLHCLVVGLTWALEDPSPTKLAPQASLGFDEIDVIQNYTSILLYKNLNQFIVCCLFFYTYPMIFFFTIKLLDNGKHCLYIT